MNDMTKILNELMTTTANLSVFSFVCQMKTLGMKGLNREGTGTRM